jgi:hypothetical protein
MLDSYNLARILFLMAGNQLSTGTQLCQLHGAMILFHIIPVSLPKQPNLTLGSTGVAIIPSIMTDMQPTSRKHKQAKHLIEDTGRVDYIKGDNCNGWRHP